MFTQFSRKIFTCLSIFFFQIGFGTSSLAVEISKSELEFINLISHVQSQLDQVLLEFAPEFTYLVGFKRNYKRAARLREFLLWFEEVRIFRRVDKPWPFFQLGFHEKDPEARNEYYARRWIRNELYRKEISLNVRKSRRDWVAYKLWGDSNSERDLYVQEALEKEILLMRKINVGLLHLNHLHHNWKSYLKGRGRKVGNKDFSELNRLLNVIILSTYVMQEEWIDLFNASKRFYEYGYHYGTALMERKVKK